MNTIEIIASHYKETRERVEKEKFNSEILPFSKIVFDNNALLDPLRIFAHSEKIFSMLDKVSEYTYIPYITQVEYMNNESGVVQKSQEIIEKSNKVVKKLKKHHMLISKGDLETLLIDKLLKDRNSKLNPNDILENFYQKTDEYAKKLVSEVHEKIEILVDELTQELKKSQSQLNQEFDWGYFGEGFTYNKSGNLKLYQWLNKIRMGDKYSEDELDVYLSMIEKRYQGKISPGYQDIKDKEGKFIQIGSKIVQKAYSDALFWLETLKHIELEKDTNLRYLIIVSNEKKADWVENSKPNCLNKDMVIECVLRTGLLPIKLTFEDLLEFQGDMSNEELESIKEQLNEQYSFSLYQNEYNAKNQREFMERIFEIILSKEDGTQFLSPCLRDTSKDDWKNTTTFDSYKLIYDKNGQEFAVGTALNRADKFRYISRLLETRVKGSSGQLKFMDSVINDEWKSSWKK